MIRPTFFPFIALLFVFLTGCQRVVEYEVEPIIVNPADPVSFSRYLSLPPGSTRTVGTPPTSTTGGPAPSVSATNTGSVITSNGSTAVVTFNVSTPAGSQASGYYVRVQGSDMYYTVPIDPANPGQFTLPLGIPSASQEGRFCVEVWAYDDRSRVSTPVTQCIEVQRLGTGALQVNLSWNTRTDIDLHVLDPSGYEIYYSNRQSPTGGELDQDNLDGFGPGLNVGPENIYWLQHAPDGDYKVWVEYFSGNVRTRYFVTITTPSGARSFDGVLEREGNRADIVIIRKRGNTYSF